MKFTLAESQDLSSALSKAFSSGLSKKNSDKFSTCYVFTQAVDQPLNEFAQALDALFEGHLQKLHSKNLLAQEKEAQFYPAFCGHYNQNLLVLPAIDDSNQHHQSPHAQAQSIQKQTDRITQVLQNTKLVRIFMDCDQALCHATPVALASAAKVFATHLINASYEFNEFKGAKKQKELKAQKTKQPGLDQVHLFMQDQSMKNLVLSGLKAGEAVAKGMDFAKRLADSPPNHCTPIYLSQKAKDLSKRYTSISTQVLGEKELKKLGAGAFLSVAQGSIYPPQLIVMHYKGTTASKAPVALVGKGITFDSGGISIKPSAAMDEMKYDMGGAASVFGTLVAAADLKLPINLVAVVAAAENMPGPTATRPGDIVTTLSGQTVEILNTDAEGRLVLCDTLSYVQKFKPQCIVDMATLTGACIVALGAHTSAVMSNNQALANQLLNAGSHVADPCWQLPLWAEYAEELKSSFADLPNIGTGKGAGTITAGAFLHAFVGDTPWAHLDIAGTAWKSSPKGATGRPVPLLVEFLQHLNDTPLVSMPQLKKPSKPTRPKVTSPARKKKVS